MHQGTSRKNTEHRQVGNTYITDVAHSAWCLWMEWNPHRSNGHPGIQRSTTNTHLAPFQAEKWKCGTTCLGKFRPLQRPMPLLVHKTATPLWEHGENTPSTHSYHCLHIRITVITHAPHSRRTCDKRKAKGNRPPAHHDAGKPQRRAQTLQDQVGGQLRHKVP